MSIELATIFKLITVIALGILLYAIARRGLRSLQARELLSLQTAGILSGAVKWTFLIAVTLLSLNIVGISVTSLWASLSAVMMLVAVGFVAVWSILSNATSALFLVTLAPFRIGDEIELLEPATQDPEKPGLRGKVTDISFVYTTLVETDGDGGEHTTYVPNNQFFQKAIRRRQGKDTSSLKQALFETSGDDGQDPRDCRAVNRD